MKWFIELSGTSLSEEAKRICKIHRIFSLDQLITLFSEDPDFNSLDGCANATLEEIKEFVEQVMSFFEDISNAIEEPDNSNMIADDNVDKTPIENLSVEELFNRELIDSRLHNICIDNGLTKLGDIYREYKRKGTFRHFRNSGLRTDDLLKSLFQTYSIDIDEPVHLPREERDDSATFRNSFEEFVFAQEPETFSLSQNIIEPLFEFQEEKLALFLLRFSYGLDNQRRVGNKKKEQARALIKNYFSSKPDLTRKQAKFIDIVHNIFNSSFSIDIFDLWEAYIESVQSLVYYLFRKYSGFRSKDTKDYIYIKKYLCFYEGVQPCSYEQLAKFFKEEMDDEVLVATIKPQINRTREKVDKCFLEIVSILGQVYLLEGFGLTRGVNFIMLSGIRLDELNEGMDRRLSKEYYRYLFNNLLKDNYLDVKHKKAVKVAFKDQALYYIVPKYHNEIIESIETFDKLYSTKRIESIIININDYVPIEISWEIRELFEKYIFTEYEGIEITGNNIELLPNSNEEPRNIDLIVEILKEAGEPLEYNDLIDRFDEKYPGRRGSERSLRDLMFLSEKTISLGGRSNKFLLKEWEDKYLTGHIKNLIIDYFKSIKGIDHFYRIYLTLKDNRVDVSVKAIKATLGLHNFFKSAKGGYYYYDDFPPSSPNKYTKNNQALIMILDTKTLEDLTDNRDSLIEEILRENPEYSKIQVQYAIDLSLDLID